MANSDSENQNPNNDHDDQRPSNVTVDDEPEPDEVDDDEDDEGEDEDDQEPSLPRNPLSEEARLRAEKYKLENLVHRMSTERVDLRVHDVLIKGNTKTKEHLIEAELEGIKKATTMQELLEAAGIANAKLQRLEIFDSVRITLDSGPPELPGTANVIVEVVETKSPISGEIGAYTKPAVRFLFGCIRIYTFCFAELVTLGFSTWNCYRTVWLLRNWSKRKCGWYSR